MRRKEYLRLVRHTDSIDEGHEASASYRDEGTFSASLWAAGETDQREGGRKRAMLFASQKIKLNDDDRLVQGATTYRVVWARSFTRHTEALIEEEDTPA
jgi:hypothetical protein